MSIRYHYAVLQDVSNETEASLHDWSALEVYDDLLAAREEAQKCAHRVAGQRGATSFGAIFRWSENNPRKELVETVNFDPVTDRHYVLSSKKDYPRLIDTSDKKNKHEFVRSEVPANHNCQECGFWKDHPWHKSNVQGLKNLLSW